MLKRRAAGVQKENCVRKKRKVEEAVLNSSPDHVNDGSAPVICIESHCTGDGDKTPTVILDSAHPSHQRDAAVAQQNSDDSDKVPSFETGKEQKKEPEDVPAAEGVIKKPLSIIPHADPLCTSIGPVTVHADSAGVYSFMLTRTCVEKNMNKFYKMQLLSSLHSKSYSIWCRCGRVGETGFSSLISCGDDLVKARELFEKKFYEKTKNEWSKRHNFMKYRGKYDMLKVDYAEDTESENIEQRVLDLAKETVKSRLAPSVKDLMIFMSDAKQTIIRMNFDVIRMPLGHLTREQIHQGYEALRKVDACILKSSSEKELMDACSEFYTCIPHSFPRVHKLAMIRNHEAVQMRMRLLEALEDFERAVELLKKHMENHLTHPLDKFYRSIGCDIIELDGSDSDLPIILEAVKNTHGASHCAYRLVVQNVFKVYKKFQPFSSVGNHRMLWHGSRTGNFSRILSQGLRIAPAEVPCHGVMFGKGLYFADCVSKSANYSGSLATEGLLLLCEVSLGNVKKMTAGAKRGDSLPPHGKHSVKGLGEFLPDPMGDVVMKNGATLSCGQLLKRQGPETVLKYNEYIVYSTSQVKIVYLVRVKFDRSYPRVVL